MKVTRFEGSCKLNDGDSFLFNSFSIIEHGDILIDISGDSTFGLYLMNFRLVKRNEKYSGRGEINYLEKNTRTDTIILTIQESDISYSEDSCIIKKGKWELKAPDWNETYYFSEEELERISDD